MKRRPARAAAVAVAGLVTVLLAHAGAPSSAASATSAAQASPDDVLRFQATLQGGIVVTGNAIGLSKAPNVNGPGTSDSIGTFMAVDPASVDTEAPLGAPWPAGTTNVWQQDASSAVLTLPAGATVEYAELVWGGSYDYGGEVTTAGLLDSHVTLTSGGASTSVAPDPLTATTIATTGHSATTTFAANYYQRSADVTAAVAAHGSGTYRVAGIPATQASSINSLSAGGWSLAVVYGVASAPIRWVGLRVGAKWIDELATQDRTFTGFCTPSTGSAHGSLAVSSLEGDANLTGDQLLASPDGTTFTHLSGPNNPQTNFFASQINGADGTLDSSGTFGSANHSAGSGTNVSGGRQGWDVTTVAVPDALLGTLEAGTTVRTMTTGDSLVPVLLGLQTDVGAPSFAAGSSLSSTSIVAGTSSTFTVPVANTGTTAAFDVTFTLPVPAGLAAGSVTVDGFAASSADLATGLDLGTIPTGATRTVRVQLTGLTAGTQTLAPTWHYSIPCVAPTTTFDADGGSRLLTVTAASGGGGSGASGGGGASGAPQTTITRHPKKKGTKRAVRFSFGADDPAATFTCSLDGKAFEPCVPGQKFKVAVRRHTFAVRATDAAGNTDASPATYRFKVVHRIKR